MTGSRQTDAESISSRTARLGYIHIPDMGAAGIREFIKWYYPQLNKDGLVIDVRANGGGNVSRMIIERLSRKVLGINFYSRAIRTRRPILMERFRADDLFAKRELGL